MAYDLSFIHDVIADAAGVQWTFVRRNKEIGKYELVREGNQDEDEIIIISEHDTDEQSRLAQLQCAMNL